MDGATIVVESRLGAPYEPGYLALRVGVVLEAAVRSLRIRPDVLLVNGTGFDHPRHAGLALHLGAVLDLPTIGVTDRTLSGGVGARHVRPTAHARPVWVHAGWETDLETACSVVAQSARGNRTPEALRQARQLARLARSQQSRAGRP
jgi:deoxyribonuclease V